MGEDKQWYQVLGERSCIPLCLRKPNKFPDHKKLVNDIFAASYEMEKRQQFTDALKNAMQDKILWFITIPCITLGMIYAIHAWKG
jgi:hypothetical protein